MKSPFQKKRSFRQICELLWQGAGKALEDLRVLCVNSHFFLQHPNLWEFWTHIVRRHIHFEVRSRCAQQNTCICCWCTRTPCSGCMFSRILFGDCRSLHTRLKSAKTHQRKSTCLSLSCFQWKAATNVLRSETFQRTCPPAMLKCLHHPWPFKSPWTATDHVRILWPFFFSGKDLWQNFSLFGQNVSFLVQDRKKNAYSRCTAGQRLSCRWYTDSSCWCKARCWSCMVPACRCHLENSKDFSEGCHPFQMMRKTLLISQKTRICVLPILPLETYCLSKIRRPVWRCCGCSTSGWRMPGIRWRRNTRSWCRSIHQDSTRSWRHTGHWWAFLQNQKKKINR